MIAHDIQREADAAFFEDWTPWVRFLRPYPKYDGGAFCLNVNGAAIDIVSRLPGAKRQKRDRYDNAQNYWWVPAANWRCLKRALPAIAAAQDAWGAAALKRAAAERRSVETQNAEVQALVGRRLAEARAGVRDLGGVMDALAGAWLHRDPALTAWERAFVLDHINRWARDPARFACTPKQRAVLDRIHDKIKHALVL